MKRGITAETDLGAVISNYRTVKEFAEGRQVIAVVKADAYGHGAVEVARALESEGAEYLGVAFSNEAETLRAAGIVSKIIVLFDPDPADVLKYDLIPVVSDTASARALSACAKKERKNIKLHINIDTGMGRLGLLGDVRASIREIASLEYLVVDGLMSHFSEADLADPSFAERQIRIIKELRSGLMDEGLNIPLFHMANSAAIISLPNSHFDAVRPGLMLYGCSPFGTGSHSELQNRLAPVLRVTTSIIGVRKVAAGTPVSYGRTFVTSRESVIGVAAAGYADGYFRRFSNNAFMLVNGKRVPVAGRVCMDLTMIDLTEAGVVREGDKAVIIGNQGSETILAEELAERAGTIPYEILTSLGRGSTQRVFSRHTTRLPDKGE